MCRIRPLRMLLIQVHLAGDPAQTPLLEPAVELSEHRSPIGVLVPAINHDAIDVWRTSWRGDFIIFINLY